MGAGSLLWNVMQCWWPSVQEYKWYNKTMSAPKCSGNVNQTAGQELDYNIAVTWTWHFVKKYSQGAKYEAPTYLKNMKVELKKYPGSRCKTIFYEFSIMQENTCFFHVTIFCCWRLRWMSSPILQLPIRISHFLHSLTWFKWLLCGPSKSKKVMQNISLLPPWRNIATKGVMLNKDYETATANFYTLMSEAATRCLPCLTGKYLSFAPIFCVTNELKGVQLLQLRICII